MKLANNICPASDRVLLEPSVEAELDVKGGIIIPNRTLSLDSGVPGEVLMKHKWHKAIAVGKACFEIQAGDEVLVHDAAIELVQPQGKDENRIEYVREAQIIAFRRAQLAQTPA